jgi:hypothetical protein
VLEAAALETLAARKRHIENHHQPALPGLVQFGDGLEFTDLNVSASTFAPFTASFENSSSKRIQ